MSGHTPGPWKIDATDDSVRDSNEHQICDFNWTDDVGRSQANARLIASAPELLAALRNLVDAAESTSTLQREHRRAACVIARSAIARAEGRQP